jgi:hypothetical protein
MPVNGNHPTRSSGPGQSRKTNQRQAKLPLVLEEADRQAQKPGNLALLLLENVARGRGRDKRVVIGFQQVTLRHRVVGRRSDCGDIACVRAITLLKG